MRSCALVVLVSALTAAPILSPLHLAFSHHQHVYDVHRDMFMDLRLSGGVEAHAQQCTPEQRISGEEPRSWNNVAPTWSPDGSQIAFLTDRTGRWEIWVMQADGSDQHPLFPQVVQAQLNLQYNGVDERMISWEAQ